MVNFTLRLGKWIKVQGKDLKGNELIVALIFLMFSIGIIVYAVCKLCLPKIQSLL